MGNFPFTVATESQVVNIYICSLLTGEHIASVPGLPRYTIYCARLIVRGRETLKRGRPGMKHHVPIDAPGRARPVASTANMYTLASVRLLSFWLTPTCSSAVKAFTYAYHTCVKRSRVYTFIHSCGRGNGARATRRSMGT